MVHARLQARFGRPVAGPRYGPPMGSPCAPRQRRPFSLALAAPVLALAAALSGCSGTIVAEVPASATGAAAGARAPDARATARAAGAGPLARVASRGLAVSRVTRDVVQPQPAPGSCHARGVGSFSLPDPRCTPGAIDPAVRQSNIASTICRSGYTRTVRPPAEITAAEKRASMAAYGDHGSPRAYEYDHLVPLELGGAANDPRNLWPEPGHAPNPKDALENSLRDVVCGEAITLTSAQRQIAGDWVAIYHLMIR